VATGRPSLYRIAIRYDGQSKTYLRLAMPLADDGATVNMILTVSDRIAPATNKGMFQSSEEPQR
jgi:hypothetical protein